MRFHCNIALCALFLLYTGCGKSSGVAVVPVSGNVTIAGAAPTKEGRITFTVIEPAKGYPSRPGTAKFAADGSFVATSFEEGDGLVPGTYSAVIQYYEQEPTDDDPTSFERLNLVPLDYRPEVVVDKDAGSVKADFNVPAKKQ
jgi:hypothetical protein